MDVTVEHNGWALAGTVEVPAAEAGRPLAAIVLVHGSGPATREAPYWTELAAGVRALGIATLRYDKPGCGGSPGDWRMQDFEDRARESLAALDVLAAAVPEARCVGLAGGSQGGWIATLAASRSPAVEFAICYSAAGVTPGEQEHFRLLHHLPAEGFTLEQARSAADVLARRIEQTRLGVDARAVWDGEQTARREPWFDLLGGAEYEELVFDLAIYDFDPRPVLARVRCPVLGIWGSDDVMVPVERSADTFRESSVAAGRRLDEYVVLPGLGHNLRDAGGAISRDVLDRTVAWLRSVCVERR